MSALRCTTNAVSAKISAQTAVDRQCGRKLWQQLRSECISVRKPRRRYGHADSPIRCDTVFFAFAPLYARHTRSEVGLRWLSQPWRRLPSSAMVFLCSETVHEVVRRDVCDRVGIDALFFTSLPFCLSRCLQQGPAR